MDVPVGDPNDRQTDVVLKSAGGTCWGCALILIALVWNALVWSMGYAVLQDGNAPFMAKAVLGIFALVGIGLAFAAVVGILARSKMGRPELTISAQPLNLGEPFTCRFSQKVKSSAKVNEVKVTLICRESATYSHGTDSSTDTHDVLKVEQTILADASREAGGQLAGEFEFTIPENGMHTFDGGDNEIAWLIETHTDVAGWPDYAASYSLKVAARRHVSGEGVN